jgi:2-oxoglutarate/2-oxoacid ferredoxin oxidoreductase subunit beta
MITKQDHESRAEIQWCPGCPNFGILQAMKMAFGELQKAPHEICLVSGIGQAAKLPHYLACNFFNGLHGRAIPVALGIQAVNPRLTTLVVTGEGDCYGEGGNHFLHALRRNPDITIAVHNNEIYALTKGQASPTTRLGEKRSLHLKGVEIPPLNMPAIAIVHNCTFVARGFAGDIDHLQELLVKAINHPGLSYVDIIQPCITWGTHPLSWYRERVYKLGPEYDPGNRTMALAKALEGDDGIPLGILYRTAPRKSFGSTFRETRGDSPLAEATGPGQDKIVELLSRFRSGG